MSIFTQKSKEYENLRLFLAELEKSKYGNGFFDKFVKRLRFEVNITMFIGAACMVCTILLYMIYACVALLLQCFILFIIFQLLIVTPAGMFSVFIVMNTLMVLNIKFSVTYRILLLGITYGQKLINKISNRTSSKIDKIHEKFLKGFKNLTC